MHIDNDVVEAIGHTPLDQAEARVGDDGLHHSRQGRVHESRPVGEGPAGKADDPRGGETRRPEAGRPRRRRHGRKYRDRPCHCRRRPRLPHHHRDPEHAKPGKEGYAAAVRRRTGRGAGAALQQSEQLSARRKAARRSACANPNPTACCSPISGTTSTIRKRITFRPARRSGSRPAARSTASSARSAPAARWRAPARSCARRKRTS